MKLSIIFAFVFISFLSSGKGIDRSFIVRADMGTLYTLNLKKDRTYKYIRSSIDWDTGSTLDSGTYELKDKCIITFHSKCSENKGSFNNVVYYLKEKNVKKYEENNTYGSVWSQRETLFGKKISILFKNSNDSIRIRSTRPIDNIRSGELSKGTSVQIWFAKNILPAYGFKEYESDSSYWKNLVISNRLSIIWLSDFKYMFFQMYYKIDDTIYYTNYPTVFEYQEVLLQKCYKEKLISREQKKMLEQRIKEWIATEENRPRFKSD